MPSAVGCCTRTSNVSEPYYDMALCTFGDMIIKSPLPLGMVEVEGGEPDCELVFPPSRLSAPTCRDWFHHFADRDGKPWLSLGKHGCRYLFRFHNLVDFWVSADGGEILGYPTLDVPSDTIRHLFLDQVMPRMLSLRGRLVLHASAVLAPKGAVAFLGDSGRGKSTLAASFCQQGFPGLTDDCLLLQEAGGAHFALPSYAGLRLWPDTIEALFGSQVSYPLVAHYTDKRRLSSDREPLCFATGRVPLNRLYMLAPPDDQTGTSGGAIHALSSREAVMALVNSTYRLDITDRERLEREFHELSRLAMAVGLWRLVIPKDFSLLPTVHQIILQHLEESA